MPRTLENFCRENKLIEQSLNFSEVIQFILTQPALMDVLNNNKTDLNVDIVKNHPDIVKGKVQIALDTYMWTLTLTA